MPLSVKFIKCRIMKKAILLILVFPIMASCMGSQHERIKKATEDAINQIHKEANSVIDIEADNIIKKRVQEYTERKLWLSYVSVIVGMTGLFVGIISLSKVRKIRKGIDKKALGKIVRKLIDEDNAREHRLEQGSIDNVTLKEKIKSIILEADIIESITSEIAKKTNKSTIEELPAGAQKVSGRPDTGESHIIELYARDSSSQVLSEVYTYHLIGKTLYKLTLDDQNATFAVLDVCTDKEDVVGRLLRFNDEDLEAICILKRLSLHPDKVNVLKKGRAERISSQEWKVIEKIELELS